MSTKQEAEPRRKYGQRFLKLVEEINNDPQNLFGQQVINWLMERQYPLKYLQNQLMLPGEGMFNLLRRDPRNLLFEAEIILRLALLMGVDGVELYQIYLQSHGNYPYSTSYGPFGEKNLTPEQTTALSASFGTIWHAFIAGAQGNEEEIADLAVETAKLVTAYCAINPERRSTLAQMVRMFTNDIPDPLPGDPGRFRQKRRYTPRAVPVSPKWSEASDN